MVKYTIIHIIKLVVDRYIAKADISDDYFFCLYVFIIYINVNYKYIGFISASAIKKLISVNHYY